MQLVRKHLLKVLLIVAVFIGWFSNGYIQKVEAASNTITSESVTSFVLHPNGKDVYYTKDDGSSTGPIYKYDLTRNIESIAFAGSYNAETVLSVKSDGSFLYFSRPQPNESANTEYYALNLTTLGVVKLVTLGYGGGPYTPGYYADSNSTYNIFYTTGWTGSSYTWGFLKNDFGSGPDYVEGHKYKGRMVYRNYFYHLGYNGTGFYRVDTTYMQSRGGTAGWDQISNTIIPDSYVGAKNSNSLFLNAAGKIYKMDSNNTSNINLLTTGEAVTLNSTEDKLMVLDSNKFYEVDIQSGSKTLKMSNLPVSPTKILVVSNFNGIVYQNENNQLAYQTFNTDPTISLTSPSNNRILSEVPGYNKLTIAGTVKDQDVGDKLTVKYQIDSAAAKSIQTITATGANQPITDYILIDASISEGAHVLKVWVEDDKGGMSSIETRSFIVDKTPPAQPVLVENPPGKAPSKQITITYSGDSAVKEYQIGTGAWTAYIGPFTIKQNGTITARATDAAGNKSTKSIAITNINPPDPIVTVSNVTNSGFTVTDTGTYTDPVEYQFDLYVEGNAALIATYPSASTWQDGKSYTFTELNPNVKYKAVVRVSYK